MTNKEASFILANIDRRVCDDELSDALDMAIKALEQQPCDDCISREQAKDAMYALCDETRTFEDNPWRDNPHIDAIIDGLDDLPSVTPKAEQKAILDKIRAEIEQITDTMGVSYNQYVSKIDVLQIIDKYKAED